MKEEEIKTVAEDADSGSLTVYVEQLTGGTRTVHCVLAGLSFFLMDILHVFGDMTSFRYGNNNIRFRSPKCLKRYTEVKEWDNGYIVVMADYEGLGETEEYIDLLPILKNLSINPETFLKPIKSVKIDYHNDFYDGE